MAPANPGGCCCCCGGKERPRPIKPTHRTGNDNERSSPGTYWQSDWGMHVYASRIGTSSTSTPATPLLLHNKHTRAAGQLLRIEAIDAASTDGRAAGRVDRSMW